MTILSESVCMYVWKNQKITSKEKFIQDSQLFQFSKLRWNCSTQMIGTNKSKTVFQLKQQNKTIKRGWENNKTIKHSLEWFSCRKCRNCSTQIIVIKESEIK